MSDLPASVKIKEVGPRDGLQAEAAILPTENLVHVLHDMGKETGADLGALIGCARLLEELLGHELPGHVTETCICGHLTAEAS